MQTPIIVRGNHVMVPVEISDGRRKAHLFLQVRPVADPVQAESQ